MCGLIRFFCLFACLFVFEAGSHYVVLTVLEVKLTSNSQNTGIKSSTTHGLFSNKVNIQRLARVGSSICRELLFGHSDFVHVLTFHSSVT